VEIKWQPNYDDRTSVILGADVRTNYSFVDLTKIDDPLPDVENECAYQSI